MINGSIQRFCYSALSNHTFTGSKTVIIILCARFVTASCHKVKLCGWCAMVRDVSSELVFPTVSLRK